MSAREKNCFLVCVVVVIFVVVEKKKGLLEKLITRFLFVGRVADTD